MYFLTLLPNVLPKAGLFNFSDYLDVLLKQIAAPILRAVIQWIGRWILKVCISNKFLGDAGTAGPRTTLIVGFSRLKDMKTTVRYYRS